MPPNPFVLVTPATRGLSLALTRHFLRTTDFPVYATHRSGTPASVSANILQPLPEVDPARLKLLRLDLLDEPSIAAAAQHLADTLPAPNAHLHTAFLTGGVLHAEKHSADLDPAVLLQTFQTNVIAHLLLIKHFARFLPSGAAAKGTELARWVHVSARVGSVSDNRRGGWYSYRASKAALNQVVKTFDLQLQMKKGNAMCVGVHPGTVKTELSREFWRGVPEDKLFGPEYAAQRVIDVVNGLNTTQRGRIWDWAGKEVLP